MGKVVGESPHKVGERKKILVRLCVAFVLCSLMPAVVCVVGYAVRPARSWIEIMAFVGIPGVGVALFGGCLLLLWLLLFVWRNRRWLC